jgi:hypothetical protein
MENIGTQENRFETNKERGCLKYESDRLRHFEVDSKTISSDRFCPDPLNN